MPNFTPGFGLPYPSSTDEPCDFDEQWCDFTQALDTVFDGFQETLNRTVPVIPIASLAITPVVIIPEFSFIPYDRVVIDTAGWTATDVDATLISPDMAAVLSLSSNALFAGRSAPGMFILDCIDSTGVLTQPIDIRFDSEMDMDTCAVGIDVEQPTLFSPGHWVLGVSGIHNSVISSGAPGNVDLEYANFTIYWHADGGTL